MATMTAPASPSEITRQKAGKRKKRTIVDYSEKETESNQIATPTTTPNGAASKRATVDLPTPDVTPSRTTSEKNSRYGKSPATVLTMTTSEDEFWAGDTEIAEDGEVERLLDTDTEGALSTQASFIFSGSYSRTTSMTSFTSVSSSGSTLNPKRVLSLQDTDDDEAPGSPSSKSRKVTRSTSAAQRSLAGSTPRTRRLDFPARADVPDMFSPQSRDTSPDKRAALVASRQLRSDPPAHSSRTAATRAPAPPKHAQTSEVPASARPSGGANVPASETTGLVIISHSATAQTMMDMKGIAWGVQYELARGVCRGDWKWEDATADKLDRLRGTNKDMAPRVAQVMTGRAGRIAEADVLLWREFDREEAAIVEDRGRALGLMGEWDEDPNWYGGKLQQVAKLQKDGNRWELKLEKTRMGKSTRFARYLGSRRLLQVNMPKETRFMNDKHLKTFLAQRFILCGRIFVPCCSKDGKAYFMEINEDYERRPLSESDKYRMSLDAFVRWHNDPTHPENTKQPVNKWVTRFELGLSTTVPGVKFAPENVFIRDDQGRDLLPDEVAPYDPSLGKAPTENIFTDGCGFINGAALALIGKQLNHPTRIVGVQGRIAGAKGVWLLHPNDQSPDGEPKIWLRPSQIKVRHRELDRAHLIFDIVAPSRVLLPTRLNRYTIMNLSHNGVPVEVFEKLMRDGIEKLVSSFTDWHDTDSLIRLWHAVNKAGRVMLTRLQRRVAGTSRALGLSGRFEDADNDNDDQNPTDVDVEESASSTRDPFSGRPDGIFEKVLDLLQAGFHPLRLPQLFDDVERIIKIGIDDYLKDYHIDIPLSAEAYIVPDPYGVLEEGQIHFKASQNLKDWQLDPDGKPSTVIGDVLIYRNPARVPSDVRKVRAVDHPRLSEYVDVIVLPTKGARSLANILAGGDVDGDTCICIFDPEMVHPFTNSPIADATSDFLAENFEPEGNIQTVAQLVACSDRTDSTAATWHAALLSGLSAPSAGIYSNFHEFCVYTLGYDHLDTLRVAFMFNTVLDSKKTGLKVKEAVFKSDKRRFDRPLPECMNPGDSKGTDSSNPSSSRKLPNTFILDQLLSAGRGLKDKHLIQYKTLKAGLDTGLDVELCQPIVDARILAQSLEVDGYHKLATELQRITDHVDEQLPLWVEACARSGKHSFSPTKLATRSPQKSMSPTKAQGLLLVNKSFSEGPPCTILSGAVNVAAIKAAYAYQRHPTFAFSVAFKDLCDIKARAVGAAPFTRAFADAMSTTSAGMRILERFNHSR